MSNLLPSKYKELEYIESSGTQYIDTDIQLSDNNFLISTDITPLEHSSREQPIFSIWTSQYRYWNVFINSSDKINLYLNSHNIVDKDINFGEKINIKTIRTNNTWELNYNGTAVYKNYNPSSVNNTTIKLFARGDNVSHTKIRMYNWYIIINNMVIKKYIPCYRKEDNEIGMYDIINNKFYLNSGTGKFIAGPEINKETENIEIDWTESMEQTFEYYEVDPNTWKDIKLIENVKSCTIKRDSGADTLGSATINIADTLGECYIRIYLLAIQNGVKKRVCLGTYLVQTPSSSFDGKQRNVSMDAYTPLLELKEKPVPLGYTLLKNDNIMEEACAIVKDNCRAPVVATTSDEQLKENFVASTDDTWLTYIIDLIKQANFQFYLDEQGQILFETSKTAEELSPVYTFNDDNSSILHPDIDLTHDLYNVPNVVEIYAPNGDNVKYYRAENRDNTSPTSIQNRGREIIYRETEPNLPAYPTDAMVEEYAKNTLKRLSSVQYSVSYTHGYCPVRVGDCVRLNYSKAGLINIKAKVTSQSIRCSTGCEVSETAVFTKKLWE